MNYYKLETKNYAIYRFNNFILMMNLFFISVINNIRFEKTFKESM